VTVNEVSEVASEELAASAQETKVEARVVGEAESYESTDGPRERHISYGQKRWSFGTGEPLELELAETYTARLARWQASVR